jgi:hypothetical protein
MPRLRFCPLFFLAAQVALAQSTPRLNEIQASNQTTVADSAGDFDDWVEIYNPDSQAISLVGYFLSDNPNNPFKWQIAAGDSLATALPPGGFLLLWLDDEPHEGPAHAPFKLNAAGESLLLSAPDSTLLDSMTFDQQFADRSLARLPDGTGSWATLASPTPGISNGLSPTLPVAAAPLASMAGGLFSAPFELFFSAAPNAEIRLTFDGSVPTEGDSLFAQNIDIQSTTVVRARAFVPGWQPSATTTHTYFLGESPTIPLVSLVFEPSVFFDSLTGIYNDSLWWPELEVPVHAEWFEPGGARGFSLDLAAELFGDGSLTLPQKSLLLKARPAFGAQEIEYPIFPDVAADRYKSVALRNSGQDWGVTMFRDACVTSLGREAADVAEVAGRLPLVFQGFRPTVAFLNGQYWGIHNAREQLDAAFVARHFGLAEDSVDYIEFYGKALAGDSLEWQNFWQWLSENHFQSDSLFAQLGARNDLQSFTDYCLFHIVSDNVDWPGKNWRRFRARQSGAKWQWVPQDFDLSWGLMTTDFVWNSGFAGQNAFARAVDSTFGHWATADWQTLVLRRCLENQQFRYDFLNRTADLLNTVFRSARTKARIDSFENRYLPEIERHFERWFLSPGWLSYWQDNVQRMRNFAEARPSYCFAHAQEVFPETGGSARLSLAADPPEGGSLRLSTLRFEAAHLPWSGDYFEDIPIPLRAVANEGWYFAGWSLPGLGAADSTTLVLADDLDLVAHFERDSVPPTVDTASQMLAVQLSPNPAQGFVWAKIEFPAQRAILRNMLGIKVKEWFFEEDFPLETGFDLRGTASGAYVLEIFGAHGERAIGRLLVL